MEPKNNDTAQILQSLGQLTGTVAALQQGLTARIEDIRHDIRRIEASQTERLNHVEANLGSQIGQLRDDMNSKITGLGTRVSNLEAEDKRLIEKTAKLSALGGGIGGALAAAAVELIKRI